MESFQASLDVAAVFPVIALPPQFDSAMSGEIDVLYRRLEGMLDPGDFANLTELAIREMDGPVPEEPSGDALEDALVKVTVVGVALVAAVYLASATAGDQLVELLRYVVETGVLIGSLSVQINDELSSRLPDDNLIGWVIAAYAIRVSLMRRR